MAEDPLRFGATDEISQGIFGVHRGVMARLVDRIN
jgi:hypothetical protein